METSKKSLVCRGLDTDGKKWDIAEISIRASLKPVKTKLKRTERDTEAEEEHYSGSEEYCITPTAKEAKLSEKLICTDFRHFVKTDLVVICCCFDPLR
ncbi:hypothetical protein F2Q70_00032006 [Brassica cretica]|uniref:Uncharacterized protein n=1 Tax=Brassica cretica TaxID=69181 RepID=A0A8S9FNB0_BRACR|nr:hypothetical protein F2Q70_00032006 [Brassica cretica]KAF2552727.1 hypothetical protein F2Q68_00036377 [Brassica cretica]